MIFANHSCSFFLFYSPLGFLFWYPFQLAEDIKKGP